MNRIDRLQGKKNLRVMALMAGDPDLETTKKKIRDLGQEAHLLEISVPFSDPAGESPAAQAAHERALRAGVNLPKILDLIQKFREESTLPVILRSYLNPLHALGYPQFFDRCRAFGLDGLAVNDLPFEERPEILELTEEAGLHLITEMVPADPGKMARMARESRGLLYLHLPEDQGEAKEMIRLIRQTSSLPLISIGVHPWVQLADGCRFESEV